MYIQNEQFPKTWDKDQFNEFELKKDPNPFKKTILKISKSFDGYMLFGDDGTFLSVFSTETEARKYSSDLGFECEKNISEICSPDFTGLKTERYIF